MSDERLPRGLLAFVVVAFAVWGLALALAVAMSGCSFTARAVPVANGWPESAEFSTLPSGAARFSSHSCGGGAIVVDHLTGVQYLMTASGVCPLLDADGTPLLVAEAGS